MIMNTKKVSWRRWKSSSVSIELENKLELEKWVFKTKARNCWMFLLGFMKKMRLWNGLLRRSRRKSRKSKTRLRRKSKPFKKCTSSLRSINVTIRNSMRTLKRNSSIKKGRKRFSTISTKKVLKRLGWSRNICKTSLKRSTSTKK